MKRKHALFRCALLGAAFCCRRPPAPPPTITYSRDVAPLLQDHCQVCHREGQMAPMPLETYDQVRPWAKSIATQVALREMPPYFAHPDSRDMRDSLYLADEEVETIVAWARNGAPEGDPADLPPPKHFATYGGGWLLGNPDIVLQPPPTFDVPATERTSTSASASTGARRSICGSRASSSCRAIAKWCAASFFEDPDGRSRRRTRPPPSRASSASTWRRSFPARTSSKPGRLAAPRRSRLAAWRGCFTPGPTSVSRFTTATRPARCSRIGPSFAMHLAKPDERITKAFRKGYVGQHRLNIAAGDPDSRHKGRVTVREDITVYSANAHMHRRGKSMRLSALFSRERARRRRSSGCRTTTSTGSGTTSSRRP